MTTSSLRFRELFFTLYEGLPQQGPGNRPWRFAPGCCDRAATWPYRRGVEQRIAALRLQHAGDAEAEVILDQLAQEPEMHRRFGHHYTYEFFVARKPTGDEGPGD